MKHLKLKLSAVFISAMTFANGQMITTLAGNNTPGSVNGTGAAASFNTPVGVALDGSGNLYVADAVNNEIRKIVIATAVVTTLAGNTSAGSVNGIGSAARFYNPLGIAADGIGNLYVADANNNEIRKIVISTGVVTTLAGTITTGSADGTGASAGFNSPSGVACDGSGNLYVADYYNNEIRKIVIATGVVTTLAGSISPGAIDGTGAGAAFDSPYGLTYDGSGNLYVADGANNDIRKVVISTGMVTTIAGNPIPGSSDGTGASASFNYPSGVAMDGTNNLYVADGYNNEIRKIVISTGVVTTFAGSTTTGSADGVGAAAGFNIASALATDISGNLFIGDSYNNKIRAFGISSGIDQYELSSRQLAVYPNPASQLINVKFSKPLQNETTLKIMDALGRELLTQQVYKQQELLSIDVNLLPAGIYFISIGSDKGKFVKE